MYYQTVNDPALNKFFNLFRSLYTDLCANTHHNLVYQKSENRLSCDIDYVLENPKFQSIYELTTLYKLKNPCRLRFMRNPSTYSLHRDRFEGKLVEKSLIFPLINCNSQTITSWYKIHKGELEHRSNAEFLDYTKPYIIEKLCETYLIDNQPTIINTQVFHQATNLSGSVRLIVGVYIN
jgi:hypothetical protein